MVIEYVFYEFVKVVLKKNFPNPFNPVTTISYSIPSEQKIELCIYNIKGQKVATLIDEFMGKGEHSIQWEGKNDSGRNVASGLYFYKLKTKEKELVEKMLLLK